MKERLTYIGVIILLSILLALSWGRKPKTITNTVTNEVVKTDTIKINSHDTCYIPKPVFISTRDTKIVREVDTVYVYNDYYKIREYRDTLRSEKTASFLYLYEKVSQNVISSRYYNFYDANIYTTKTITNTEYREKAHIYADFTVTTNVNNSLNLFFGLTYKTPNKGMYSLGYDPINKVYLGKIGIKLF